MDTLVDPVIWTLLLIVPCAALTAAGVLLWRRWRSVETAMIALGFAATVFGLASGLFATYRTHVVLSELTSVPRLSVTHSSLWLTITILWQPSGYWASGRPLRVCYGMSGATADSCVSWQSLEGARIEGSSSPRTARVWERPLSGGNFREMNFRSWPKG